jgi:hypothetical protein
MVSFPILCAWIVASSADYILQVQAFHNINIHSAHADPTTMSKIPPLRAIFPGNEWKTAPRPTISMGKSKYKSRNDNDDWNKFSFSTTPVSVYLEEAWQQLLLSAKMKIGDFGGTLDNGFLPKASMRQQQQQQQQQVLDAFTGTTTSSSTIPSSKIWFAHFRNSVKTALVPGYIPKNDAELADQVYYKLMQEQEIARDRPESRLSSTTRNEGSDEGLPKLGGILALATPEDVLEVAQTWASEQLSNVQLSVQSLFMNKDPLVLEKKKSSGPNGGDSNDPNDMDDDKNNNDDDDDDNKFGMAQRIESGKSLVVGALAGGIAVSPVAYLHYMLLLPPAGGAGLGLAQWEFTTDMGSLQAALFAIVYRYAIRGDTNPMLNQGVIGAFVLVRTLSNIQVSNSCVAIPLQCT